ncbi:DMT family transporter [Janthinobacterium sp. 75]|uniref:DMT family transporter n=1 Tax=Janthinobacterium sp. 75 TaxID=2135628 RepID=UPI00106241C2|nr:DMT family transporter [Janthinobacterium sp. 75]TDY36154.1 threonine/homoserine efflux transporter RhtA [Janthinobacterium sp. 75]
MKTHASPPPAFGLPELALIAITFIWGGTFLIVQHAVTVSGPLAFVAARFAVAASIGALVCRGQLRHLSKAELFTGMLIGVSIFGGYALQTYGLMHISSSKSAFITAFYVPIVPLVQWLVFKQRPRPAVWVAVVLAFVGLLLLTGTDGLGLGLGLGKGELITAIGAIAIALEIILISRVSPQLNILRVTIVQLATASLIALLLMPVMGEAPPALSKTFILSVLALGCASALIQYVMNWAQKRISATKATLIYAGEPVWAGVIGRIAGERLPGLAIVGAILIIGAGILSEWRPRRLRADGKAIAASD